MYNEFLAQSVNKLHPKDATIKTARKLKTSERTVYRIWKRSKIESGLLADVEAIKNRKKGSSDRPKVDEAMVNGNLFNTPLYNRRNLKDESAAVGIARKEF